MDDEGMDRELVESARDGRHGAGAFLVSRYAPRLLGYCRSITPGLGDVDREFIVGLAIENAMRKIDTYDSSRSPFEVWLRTFVKYAAMEWRRSSAQTFTVDPTLQDGPLAQEAAPSRDPNEPSSDRLAPLVDALYDAIPRLSLHDQVIIGLRDLDGRSFKDVAVRLQIAEATARQRHHRAKFRLKKLMEADSRIATLTGEGI